MDVNYNIAAGAMAAVAAFFTGWMATRQRHVETKSTKETLLIDQLQEEANRLRDVVDHCEKMSQEHYNQIQLLRSEINDLRHGLYVLSNQLRELGIIPRWSIDEGRKH